MSAKPPAAARRRVAALAPTLSLRLEFGGEDRIGPGKIDLLEAVRREYSIAAAARAMGMSYRRAWLLIDTMNRMFATPVIVARPGRAREGKSAELTQTGEALVSLYRDAEAQAARACQPMIDALVAKIRNRGQIRNTR